MSTLGSMASTVPQQHQSSRRSPTSKSFIDSLPVVAINNDSSSHVCSICTDEFEVNEKVNQLPCKHVFHRHCIIPWLSRTNTCPLCRYKFPVEPRPSHGLCERCLSLSALSSAPTRRDSTTARAVRDMPAQFSSSITTTTADVHNIRRSSSSTTAAVVSDGNSESRLHEALLRRGYQAIPLYGSSSSSASSTRRRRDSTTTTTAVADMPARSLNSTTTRAVVAGISRSSSSTSIMPHTVTGQTIRQRNRALSPVVHVNDEGLSGTANGVVDQDGDTVMLDA